MPAAARIAAKLRLPIFRMFILPAIFYAAWKPPLLALLPRVTRLQSGVFWGEDEPENEPSCDPGAPGIGMIHEGCPPP